MTRYNNRGSVLQRFHGIRSATATGAPATLSIVRRPLGSSVSGTPATRAPSGGYSPRLFASKYRSASSAAMHPVPAAVTACR